MSSSTGPVGLVLTVAAVFSVGILWTTGVAQFGGATTSSEPRQTASAGCDEWVFPYVKRGCTGAAPANTQEVPAVAAVTKPAAVATAQPQPASPDLRVQGPARIVSETGSVRAPALPEKPALAEAPRAETPKPAPVQLAEAASQAPRAPAPEVAQAPRAPEQRLEPAKALEPTPPAKPRKPVEPIRTVRPVDKPPAPERTEPPARNVRVIPIDRTYLATVPPGAPSGDNTSEPQAAGPTSPILTGRTPTQNAGPATAAAPTAPPSTASPAPSTA